MGMFLQIATHSALSSFMSMFFGIPTSDTTAAVFMSLFITSQQILSCTRRIIHTSRSINNKDDVYFRFVCLCTD